MLTSHLTPQPRPSDSAYPLSVTHPAIAAQWDTTRNEGLTADDVSTGTDYRAWWTCPQGHHWQALVGARVAGVAGCRSCAGRSAGLTADGRVDRPVSNPGHPHRGTEGQHGSLTTLPLAATVTPSSVWL